MRMRGAMRGERCPGVTDNGAISVDTLQRSNATERSGVCSLALCLFIGTASGALRNSPTSDLASPLAALLPAHDVTPIRIQLVRGVKK